MKHLILILALACAGCSTHNATVAPTPVHATQASFSGNMQNSGVIDADASGFLVDQSFLYRHALTATSRGVKVEGQNFRITAEVMSASIEADQAKRNARK